MGMNGRHVFVTALVVAAVILLAGILVAPQLTTQAPPTNSNQGAPSGAGSDGTAPSSTENFTAPTWHSGDWWRYNVSIGDPEGRDSAILRGWILKTMKGTETTAAGPAYNVTVTASYDLASVLSTMDMERSFFESANVTGYVLYRATDLARIADAFTIRLNGSAMYENRTVSVTYEAKVWASYTPPLAVWSWPLTENETWDATSNVSAAFASTVTLTYGNHTYEAARSANVTKTLELVFRTGSFANLTVPAGNFRALPVGLLAPGFARLEDRLANDVLNVTEALEDSAAHPVATRWYSGQAGNVVKAESWFGPTQDLRLEAVLVAYAYG